jgi:hypothetical protein
MGSFLGAQMPQNSIKNNFLVVLDYLFYKNGPMDLVRGLFSNLNIGTHFPPTYGPSSTFLVSFGGCPNAPKQHKKLFSGSFGLFLLQG